MFLSNFGDPAQVVRHPQLEPEVKRAILASWASDAHAVEHQPALRHPPGVDRPLQYDDVMAALRDLDRGAC
ncbi:hypothetical protein GKE62_15610 [Novosphingobium sp. Gsoil 351]|nr:hypothetical protein [Novosphingobium sp. Gsoil 351]QGN54970.1 hypothetical protein GKE62_10800 [Novosphingobium sp. Gsoil 351]QGN55763.1 hypothetical protein GKE62_15610 [Novosphingobium sp. Gsoil 351]